MSHHGKGAGRRSSTADIFQAALVSGTIASLLSSLALAWRGRHDARDAAAPLNGPSQWVWGRRASWAHGFSVRHTVVGYGIHHLASIFWAVGFEALRARWRQPWPAIAAAAGTAAAASFVDYHCTPERLQPGFERRLSRTSVGLVYAAFAAGLAAAALSRRRTRR